MRKINRQGNDYAILKSIRELTLEEFSEFIDSIKKDSKKFIERLIIEFIPIERPDLVINDNNDLCNLKVKDFINISYTKRENPIEKLIEIYNLLIKNLTPTAGFITGSFKSISFEQVPERPIGSKNPFYHGNLCSKINIIQTDKLSFDEWSSVEINFSDKKDVNINTKNNIVKLSL